MLIKTHRIELIDVLRGAALIAMTIYHFTWDLEFFNWVLPLTITEPGWVYFARAIASTFLFLAGFSLVLAHGKGIRWASFKKRLGLVAAAAALISLVTYFAFPNGFIFFGILHAIALFSLLGLAFLRLPWWVCLVAAILVFGIAQTWSHAVFYTPALWWVGLAPTAPPSNDYVPLFPWFSATLAGMAAAKLTLLSGRQERLAAISLPARMQNPLSFIGRNSLIYYLVHQPVLLAAVWTFTQIAGPPDRTAGFVKICTVQCTDNRDDKFCRAYCGCMGTGMKSARLITPFYENSLTTENKMEIDKIQSACVAKQN